MWLIETGGKRPEFWASTMREIALDLAVADARHKADEQIRRWHTWHVAALPNVKKFPSYKEFLGPVEPAAEKPKRRQTIEEQIAIARAWSAISDRQR